MAMSLVNISCLITLCCLYGALQATSVEANQGERLQKLQVASRNTAAPRRVDHSYNLAADLLESSARAGVVQQQDGGLMDADKIDSLPGQPANVDFDQYSGYVTVDSGAGRALFYYFAESPQNSFSNPLVLWLNGGPGCSSLGFGAMAELGPFRVNSDGKTLYRNPYAWNSVANVLFMESPAGVGFSYSNTSSDYDQSGDKRTAIDAYIFLLNWLEKFPQYKTRDFYITGESYAGHYIPQLAATILANNNAAKRTIINLKGIAIGNAYFDNPLVNAFDTNTMGTYEFFWTHALISDQSRLAILSKCRYQGGNSMTNACSTALGKADTETGHIDDYNIYAPRCMGIPSDNGYFGSVYFYDPCTDNYVDSYLNLEEVQTALHAKLSTNWSACNNSLPWVEATPNMLPTLRYIISQGLPMWIYSGDIDSVVPVTSTRYSIRMLDLPVQTSWRPWTVDDEVGGYVVGYQGLTFATVRAAGHEVPSYQPRRALVLFSSFLQGKLPSA